MCWRGEDLSSSWPSASSPPHKFYIFIYLLYYLIRNQKVTFKFLRWLFTKPGPQVAYSSSYFKVILHLSREQLIIA